MVVFGNNASVAIRLNEFNNQSKMLTAIDNLQYLNEGSNKYAGLKVLREQLFSTANGARSNVGKVAVLLTDGASNIQTTETVPEALAVKIAGIKTFVIGIGSNLDIIELEGIASSPLDSFLMYVTNFQALVDSSINILGTACYASSKSVMWLLIIIYP